MLGQAKCMQLRDRLRIGLQDPDAQLLLVTDLKSQPLKQRAGSLDARSRYQWPSRDSTVPAPAQNEPSHLSFALQREAQFWIRDQPACQKESAVSAEGTPVQRSYAVQVFGTQGAYAGMRGPLHGSVEPQGATDAVEADALIEGDGARHAVQEDGSSASCLEILNRVLQ
jgi:hypothetical protein